MKKWLMLTGAAVVSLVAFAADPKPDGGPYTETVNGIEWTFMVKDGAASVGSGSDNGMAVPQSTTGSIIIPSMLGGNYVTNIRSYAFRGCTGLANVTIPNSVTSIGDFAFEGCSRLTSVTISSSVWTIGSSAFEGCSGLTSVTIPEGVTSIANFAFRGCCGLTSVAIPSSVRSILGGAFNCCSGLTSFEVDKANQDYKSENGLLLTKDGTALVSGVNGDVTIPSSVSSIRWVAFYGCSGLTSVTIPSGVTSIGSGAFNVCSGLTSFEVDKANPNYKSENGLLLAKDGTALVFGVNGDVTIPLGVTSIGDLAFDGCSGLMSVTIPDSVTSIGYYAFRGCSGLTSMEMPEGVTNIGEGVFCDCSGLTSVTIPSGVTSVGYMAFYGCRGLTSVAIPNSVTSIGDNAFYNCSGLTSIVVPSSVTSIGSAAFSGCNSLDAVDFEGAPPGGVEDAGIKIDAAIRYNGMYHAEWDPVIESCGWTNAKAYAPSPFPDGGPYKEAVDGIEWTFMVTNGCASVGTGSSSGTAVPQSTTGNITIPSMLGGNPVAGIGHGAFYYHGRLTSVTIPNSVTTISGWAFCGCSGLTSVAIPSSVTSIGTYAFSECSGLTSVAIPSGVTSIGIAAFMYCSGLTSVTIPSSVTSIGTFAFSDCSGLSAILVELANPNYKSEDGLLLTKDGRTLVAGVNSDVTIPSSVTSVGSYAFYSCSGLTSIVVPSSVTSIGIAAFMYCSGLTSVTIPSSVTSIACEAFSGCSGLEAILVEPANSNYKSEDGLLLTKDGRTLVAGVKGDVTIPSSVTSIGDSAFYGCSGLTSVAIPSSVTSIGTHAFYDCSGLTSVAIPFCVTSIGDRAFYGCSGLTSVAIPSSVTSVGISAFCLCSGLMSVTIPSSVTSISEYAFSGCNSLEAVDFEGAPPGGLANASIKQDAAIRYNAAYAAEWLPVIADCGFTNATPYVQPKPDGGPYTETVDGIEWTFMVTNGCASVGAGSSGSTAVSQSTPGNITIPSVLGGNIVTSIGDYAFHYCSELTSVTIPEGVTSIGKWAFRSCSGLTSVTIPNSVTSIGDNAFYSCSGLTNVTIPNGVTSIGIGAFRGCGGLTSITIPNSVTSIGRLAFYGCSGLMSVTLEGDAPASEANIFTGTPSDMVVHVKGSSSGWTQWNGRVIRFDADSGSGAAALSVNVNMTITNVIVHYIQTSELSPMAAPVTKDVGIVNVMTEVKGGNVSIPESWATNWPSFKATFGEDFSDALTRQTGKFDAGGKPMMVWQDFVAGTDPTDENDVFKASITTDANGNLIISYTPKLSEAEKAKRKYTTWGKVKLRDEKWVEVQAGHEDDYNFFKVTVEMR